MGGTQPHRQGLEILTPNLVIRPYRREDVGELAQILGDPTTMAFWPRPYTAAETAAWIERSLASYERIGCGRYPVRERQSGELVGDCGILAIEVQGRQVHDLGFIFRHDIWGRGYATEAATAIRDMAFVQLFLPRINAIIPWNHVASQRVAEKIGMRKVSEFANPRNHGTLTYFYKLSRDGWQTLVPAGQMTADRP